MFISALDTEPYVRAAQLPFIPYCEKEFPLGSVRQRTNQQSKLQGQGALKFVIGEVANVLKAAFRNLPQTLQQARVDALVLDQVDYGPWISSNAPRHSVRPCLERSSPRLFREHPAYPF